MSMNNKQRWMGGVVLLGGGLLLTALLLKGKDEIHQTNVNSTPSVEKTDLNAQVEKVTPALGLDVETEKRLLEEQRRQREKAVAEQEARAAEFLAMQQQAEADAARKAAEEYATLNALRAKVQDSSDNIPPELVEDEKEKQKRLADEKLAEQKKLEQQRLAQQKATQSDVEKKEAERKAAEAKRKAEEERKAAEKKAAERKAEEERKAAEKKAAERKAEEERKAAEKKDAERKAAEEKRKAEDAKKKAEAEKARKLLDEDNDRQWMVQVALAANQANADSIAAKLSAKGYKVTKSPTSKGVRIMVGPSKDRDAADATRKKIAADASLNMKSAWVLDWVPLDKRN
jgi:colicin import membrane protein